MQVLVPEPLRKDSHERYESIREVCDFKGKTLIDIGCCNGYFMARFLNDGGSKAVGVEPSRECLAPELHKTIYSVSGKFDICFYLDLHFHEGINYLPWIKENVDILFVAPSGFRRNEDLERDLNDYFGNFSFVSSSGYANRNIYKVIVNKKQ